MQVQVDIEFDQLLKIVKKLTSRQLMQLKAEIEKEAKENKSINLETLLLNGPTATKDLKPLLITEMRLTNGGRNNLG